MGFSWSSRCRGRATAAPAAARRKLRDERGAVAGLVAIVLVALIGMTALAIDLGSWWQNQTHLQTQADAGAFAGADEFLQNPGNCPGNIKSLADQYAAPNTTTTGSDPVPTTPQQGGAEGGNVTAKTTVACPGSGSYVDVSVNNSNPGSFFSGLNPTVSAHARVSLLQVGSAGGFNVLPYSITQTQAANCCNTLVGLQLNYSSSSPSQALVCDGSSNTTNGTLMQSEEMNGCPTTQVSASSSTCQTTTPPSCLAEFNGVAEYGTSGSFDTGLLARFQNGGPRFGASCTNDNGSTPATPVSTNYSYQLPTLKANDPRLITVFVVPDNSYKFSSSNAVNWVPIVGYASFYVAGWDHDPCAPPYYSTLPAACPTTSAGPAPPAGTTCDPQSPLVNQQNPFYFGQIWGYFVKTVSAASSGVSGTIPCNPTSNAATADCVSQLTQ